MNTYTEEDIKILIAVHEIYPGLCITTLQAIKRLKGMSLYEKEPDVQEFLENIPFIEVPKYIGKNGYSMLVEWRLKIGK